MELDDYRYFDELARTLHFARSARNLGMSASALTRRVQAMEDELGRSLLVRDHKEIRLTEAGVRFASYARTQLDQWEEFQNELKSEEATPSGELKIACTVTACHTVLPRLLATFRRNFPQITLRLITQDAVRSLGQLEEGELDLAVIPTDDTLPSPLASIELARSDLVFIAPADSPFIATTQSKRRSDLNDIPFVAPLSGLEHARLMGWLRKNHLTPQIAAEVRGNEGLIAMVALGSGIALVPRLVLENSPLRSQVEELTHLKAPAGYAVSLCAKKSSLGRKLVSLLWEHTEAHALQRGKSDTLKPASPT